MHGGIAGGSAILDLGTSPWPMRRVFDLAEKLKDDQEHVRLVQALTLNKSKPQRGLKGDHGLYGSPKWWESIAAGRIRTEVVSGVIEKTYFAGQDARWGDQVNSFALRRDDGSPVNESIYAKQKSDRKLFVPGARVLMAYAFDRLKMQPASDGGINYSKVVLEVAVSTRLIQCRPN